MIVNLATVELQDTILGLHHTPNINTHLLVGVKTTMPCNIILKIVSLVHLHIRIHMDYNVFAAISQVYSHIY